MATFIASNDARCYSQQLRDLSPAHLSRIFTLASADDAFTALALSHIDKATRNIALNNPAMWSILDCAMSLAGLREFATRAGGFAAHFDIRVAPSIAQRASVATIIPTFIDAIKPFMSQWRSLTVDVPVADWMDGLLASLAELTTVNIDRLVLRVSSNGLEEDYFKRGPEAAGTIPRVPFAPKILVLDSVPAFQVQLFGSRLEDLTIRNMNLPLPPNQHQRARNGTVMIRGGAFLDLLRGAPNLRSFALTASHPEPELIENHLNIPTLTSLAVCGALSAQFALDAVTAVALRSLNIEWAPSSSAVRKKIVKNQHAYLLSSIAQRLSGLSRLRIATTAEIDEDIWTALFSALPLEHLTLEAITGPPALAALRATRPPQLTELVLRHIDDIHVIQVAQVVASRLGMEHQGVAPIRVLQVLWCEQLDSSAAERLSEGVRYVICRDVNEDDEQDLDFAMDDMQIAEGSSEEEDWEDGEHDESYMDEEDDEEDDIEAELAMLREDNRLSHNPHTNWS